MAKEKFKLETFTTPVGTAAMAFLNKPSTKFNADGVYSVKMLFKPEDISAIVTRAEQMIEAKTADVIRENPKIKKLIKTKPVYDPALDDEGDETGQVVLQFKRNAKQKLQDGTVKTNKVKLIDPEGNVVTDEIWSGSKLAIRFFMTPYFMESSKEVGVSLKITHALVAELVNGGGGDGPEDTDRLGFGKIEGSYKAKKATAAAAGGEDDEAGTEDDDSADF